MIDFNVGYLYKRTSTSEHTYTIGPVIGLIYESGEGELHFYGPDDRAHGIKGALLQDKDHLTIKNEEGTHILRPIRLSDLKGMMINAPAEVISSWECDAHLWRYMLAFVPPYWYTFRDSLI